jgi:hypothetical protein
MLGISVRGAAGLGDKLQFSSFPENWHRNTGEQVVDLDSSWMFDFNPFVVRDKAVDQGVNLWSAPWPGKDGVSGEEYVRKPIYFSLAERTSGTFGHTAYLRHPRLYRFEDLPVIAKRLVVHTTGKKTPVRSQLGEDRERVLSEDILGHLRERYHDFEIIQIGATTDIDAKVIDCRGMEDIWEVVKTIAQASIFIGVDSGPYWIAACYPHIFRKKILMQYPPEYLQSSFVPMHILNNHTHWHDASCYYFNRSTDDAGITFSYLKL